VSFLQSAVEICGLALNIVLLVLLLRGFLPKYSLLFVYNLAQFLIVLVERVLSQGGPGSADLFTRVYWTSEIIWDFLLFLLVIELINRALAGRPEREFARKILLIVLVAVVVLPFLLFHDRPRFESRWFSGASQLINFGAAIMTLVLWGALIASRNRDILLMRVCAGLGLTVAGAAFAWGIRQLATGRTEMATDVRTIADVFAAVTYILGLALWCWAFRTPPQPAPPASVENSAA
jgi:hypothetical protein